MLKSSSESKFVGCRQKCLRVFKHSFWNFAQLLKAYWRCACVICTQKYNFWQNYCNFDFDISDISLQYWLNVLRVMGEDGARGKHWLRARGITYVLQTQIFSFLFFAHRLMMVYTWTEIGKHVFGCFKFSSNTTALLKILRGIIPRKL